MRTLVIGDIHSGLKALEQVFERSHVNKDDHLIFLGDYVDGWSHAVETIDFLIALKADYKCIFLRGNHDELCHDWLALGNDNPLWHKHGGLATIASYKRTNGATRKKHISFFQELKNYYLDPQNRLFVHAGFTNLNGVHLEHDAKTFYWDRTLWEMALSLDPNLTPEDPFYPKRLTHYREIYIGHTPVTRIGRSVPHQSAQIWNIDTGAAFKGPLSMLDIHSKQLWQSDPVHLLYPNENGRN
ncbi:metallophosphoesterase [Arenibacter sp. GZD96]|uniref:metallophosphoesterase n=1 Tax=Aurantibrevibacter litoralis TaxID=3106030 RepID=UPI002B031794|nr:metallophosphoesterase [Arenibacter sp. GZD-96]MEA1785703.1 metallophosphoesterase [Arenibacter sp. GZD-96]